MAQGARPTFQLIPRGPDVARDAAHPLAQSGGTLGGEMVGDAVHTWLEHDDGQRTLMMWPRPFRARFDPLELLDDQGRVVARGGEFVTVGGGYVKHGNTFAASTVSPGRPDLPRGNKRPDA
jgi:hypothetical protein